MFGGRKKSTDLDGQQDATGKRGEAEARGPHERVAISDIPQYYADLGFGHIDLGGMCIGVPPGREVNIALDTAGQPEFHVVTEVSRVIPHAYAAPRSTGQWRTWITELREELEAQNADVAIVDGPWGRELEAQLPGAVFRVLGVDGPRWMAEVRIMSTPENAEAAAEEGREVLKHLILSRGSDPMPVREHLQLVIPEEIQQAIAQAQSQLAAQQQAQAYQQQMAVAHGQPVSEPLTAPEPSAPTAAPEPTPPPTPTAPEPAIPQVADSPDENASRQTQPRRREGRAIDRFSSNNDF